VEKPYSWQQPCSPICSRHFLLWGALKETEWTQARTSISCMAQRTIQAVVLAGHTFFFLSDIYKTLISAFLHSPCLESLSPHILPPGERWGQHGFRLEAWGFTASHLCQTLGRVEFGFLPIFTLHFQLTWLSQQMVWFHQEWRRMTVAALERAYRLFWCGYVCLPQAHVLSQ
jgi:hypothetical protein